MTDHYAKSDDGKVLINPLLKRLWPNPATENVSAAEIAAAISLIFTDSLSPVQTGALLTALHFTGWDRRADVIAACAAAMRDAATPVDGKALRRVVREKGRPEGSYRGGLCDIVGTGGDSHSTFNVSTASSLLCAPFLLLAKHGNRASTSSSGSADILSAFPSTPPSLPSITPATLPSLYQSSNYAFLFAPQFHPGMRHVAAVRKQLGWRTIFNLLGPLANPADKSGAVEARVVGVARRDLGPVFADALRRSGCRKAMVVCGEEELDEISCAGNTLCWRLVETGAAGKAAKCGADLSSESDTDEDLSQEELEGLVKIEPFTLHPEDFGLPAHPLSTVGPGRSPAANALTLQSMLRGELSDDDPVLHFVLMNAAALLVVAGVCDADESNMGDDDDGKVVKERGPGGGRWKEGVRRVKWAVRNGAAWREWERFVGGTREGM
ncbi:glycosyl transferase [Lineolata rhizophorae]|uniref:Glycosyl transferase n=1 Tax=Lineolata rhizophorae TaxID=578093 RepID=A0A6A6P9S3_9PEZI|nr:glycosyl transferase [Lineolata rhizophorae]